MKTVLRAYKSYNFRDKNPCIDEARTAVRDSGMSYAEVSEESGVSVSTLYGWFHGDTRSPSHECLMAVVRACGFDYKMVRMARVLDMKSARDKRRRAS